MAEQATNGHDGKAAWRKWTPERRAKFIATMKKKGRKLRKLAKQPRIPRKTKRHDRNEDAIVYLRHAVMRMKGPETMSQLLTKLALKTLEGE